MKKLICDSLNGITHSILAAAIHTLDRDTTPLENSVAGSWSIEIGEQSQESSAVDCGEMALGDPREATAVGKACEGKPGRMEAGRFC